MYLMRRIERVFNASNKVKNAYFLKSNYAKTIKTLETVVPSGNILYLFYESLFSSESVKKICDFLGVEYLEANFSKKVNQGRYDRAALSVNEIDHSIYHSIYEYCSRRFGNDIPDKWRT